MRTILPLASLMMIGLGENVSTKTFIKTAMTKEEEQLERQKKKCIAAKGIMFEVGRDGAKNFSSGSNDKDTPIQIPSLPQGVSPICPDVIYLVFNSSSTICPIYLQIHWGIVFSS